MKAVSLWVVNRVLRTEAIAALEVQTKNDVSITQEHVATGI